MITTSWRGLGRCCCSSCSANWHKSSLGLLAPMMQEAFLPLPAPPPSNRHTLGCRSWTQVVARSSISSALLSPNSLFSWKLSSWQLKLWCCGVVVDKSFELLRGVESLSCPSGLCVCLPSCLQRRCDPVLACHLSFLLPSHLCICHSPSCPYGKIPLSHSANVLAAAFCYYWVPLKSVCVSRRGLCVPRAHAVQVMSSGVTFTEAQHRKCTESDELWAHYI